MAGRPATPDAHRPEAPLQTRRSLLATVGASASAVGIAGLAGCTGLFETRTVPTRPGVLEDRPDGSYVPTHVEGMAMAGRVEADPYRCALTYSFPHRFWTVTGTRTERVERREEDSLHLMPVVWDAETGLVPPDLNPQVVISRDGEEVTSLSPWTMLSQRMGFHFGDNVALPAEGIYEVTVRIGTPSAPRTGSLADNAGDRTFSFTLEYSRAAVEDISYTDIPAEEEGTPGAADLMQMAMLPDTRAPPAESLPGTLRGTPAAGDAVLAVTTLTDATPFGGEPDERYLAVSARTRYNRIVLPHMALSATFTRDGADRFDGTLTQSMDPELGVHYGAVVPSLDSGDELAVSVDTPSQTARHEGYETALLDTPEVTLTL